MTFEGRHEKKSFPTKLSDLRVMTIISQTWIWRWIIGQHLQINFNPTKQIDKKRLQKAPASLEEYLGLPYNLSNREIISS